MRVGLNLVFLGERAGGVGRYARELAGALVATGRVELHLFVGRHAPADLLAEPWAPEVRWVRLPVTLEGPPVHLLAQGLGIPAVALARRLDLVHSPATVGPVRVPRLPCLVTVLDTIPLRFGAQWEAGADARRAQRVPLWCARRADRALAISAAAARDFAALGLDPARIDVTPLGVRAGALAPATPEAELRARLGLGGAPVVLCIAQKRPYKHQDALVRAAAALRDLDVRVVAPGAPTPFEAELRALAAQLGVPDRVSFPDWVSEADLEGLYGLATAFVLPSRAEGFGLPVLEAMRRGVPVACSTAGALPEVAEGAALLFDPEDQPAITEAVRRVLTDGALREDLRARGRARAAEMTWERTAQHTLAAYERALGRP